MINFLINFLNYLIILQICLMKFKLNLLDKIFNNFRFNKENIHSYK